MVGSLKPRYIGYVNANNEHYTIPNTNFPLPEETVVYVEVECHDVSNVSSQ